MPLLRSIYRNQIYGPVPSYWASWTRLRYMYRFDPPCYPSFRVSRDLLLLICTIMVVARLGHCRVHHGTLPADSACSDITENFFNGTLPDLSNLTDLTLLCDSAPLCRRCT